MNESAVKQRVQVRLDEAAREKAGMLTTPARVVMSRLKERNVLALSLAEMAMLIEPNLPGLVLPKRDPGTPVWKNWKMLREAEARSEEHDDTAHRRLDAAIEGRNRPVEHRLLGDGGLLPALEGNPRWEDALARARAVVVELETLGLGHRVEVRGMSVSEKWTLTAMGKKASQHLSIQEWRDASGKSEA